VRQPNLRFHGSPPYCVAVVHGGPGAAGEMRVLAERLAMQQGVLEPLQTAPTVDGQIEELAAVLRRHATLPVTLIGHSWGAWLVMMVAARYPALVSKLVLIGSGPFEAHYADSIMPERLRRLSGDQRAEATALMERLGSDAPDDEAFARMGELLSHADAFDALPEQREQVNIDVAIYQSIWREASELRQSGELLRMASTVRCETVAIHGDHDPHPPEGVRDCLSRAMTDFRFVLLPKCGHSPWNERAAQDEFFRLLEDELS
jgi:pimeloyl-ACP methyl ester carboxylesterase